VTEADGLFVPRRRAFSLSFGMNNSASNSVVVHESPLVLKSSSVSSVTSKHVGESVLRDDSWAPAVGKSMHCRWLLYTSSVP